RRRRSLAAAVPIVTGWLASVARRPRSVSGSWAIPSWRRMVAESKYGRSQTMPSPSSNSKTATQRTSKARPVAGSPRNGPRSALGALMAALCRVYDDAALGPFDPTGRAGELDLDLDEPADRGVHRLGRGIGIGGQGQRERELAALPLDQLNVLGERHHRSDER